VPHPDVVHEQAYVDDAYRCLEAMRERTARVADIADSAAQAVDSAVAQAHLHHRLATLDADVPGLAFGRLDEEAPARDHDGAADRAGGRDRRGEGTAPTWYVGRRHVEDAKGDPVVVDWRAEVSVPFYRATAADPLGLRRRRRFMMTDRRIDDLFDEDFDDPDSVDAAHHGGIPDPLLAELERSRTGEMRDIVATIAAEQDQVIRAPLASCLIVQGGPGTGKTAVGLHRAAFLLFEHRRQLDREGVLVIGPNPLFLRYIAQVLPSLGETAVRQTTLDRLLAGTAYRVRGHDDDRVAALKGDARLAIVLAQAAAATRRPVDGPLAARTGWGTVQLAPEVVEAAVKEVVARGVPHNVGRLALRTQLLRLVRQELAERRGEELATGLELESRLRDDKTWNRALDRLWPTLAAGALVRRVLTSRTALRAAAAGVLDGREQDALLRPATRRADDEPWTAADLALLDEAQSLITGPPPAYGHVVVDEAQDLSAMGLRALARRCPTRSMTVLGDLAQATAPAAQASWDSVIGHLGSPGTARRVDLDLGYRVPAPLMDYANQLLPTAAPDVVPTRSVRADGRPPRLVAVGGPAGPAGTGGAGDDLVGVTERIVAELAAVWGSVGVVAPDAVRHGLRRDLPATLVAPDEAKGLEFDAVVVVEPAAIGSSTDGARNLRLLYVALTRAVQELVVVHGDPLPLPLRPEPAGGC
jgi:DNA helicase IV